LLLRSSISGLSGPSSSERVFAGRFVLNELFAVQKEGETAFTRKAVDSRGTELPMEQQIVRVAEHHALAAGAFDFGGSGWEKGWVTDLGGGINGDGERTASLLPAP